jgi:hypothetical protein
MPDPHVVRQNAIAKALQENQYIAPQALNVTQSSGGGFADFDSHGNLRTSNFSPYPQVTEGYTWEQTHGLFGGPPTFYNVPGSQTSQFGPAQPPPEVHNHYWSVNAVDAPSFAKILDDNHMAVGSASAKALRGSHSDFTRAVARYSKVG